MILLLIASIFSCPFRCAVGVGCADAAESMQTHVAFEPCCDSCHRKDVEGDETPQPSSPCDDCDCLACICHGATLESSLLTLELSSVALACFFVESCEHQPQPRLSALSSVKLFPPHSPFFSGRAARIGLQSFQI